jgi:hypothetical protein
LDVRDYINGLIHFKLVGSDVIEVTAPVLPGWSRVDAPLVVEAEKKDGGHKERIEHIKDHHRANFVNKPKLVLKKHFIIFRPDPKLTKAVGKKESTGKIEEQFKTIKSTFKFTADVAKKHQGYTNVRLTRTFDYLFGYVFIQGSEQALRPEQKEQSTEASKVAKAMSMLQKKKKKKTKSKNS